MEIGRVFLVLGVFFLVVGAMLCLVPKGTQLFSWFGRLPGDISYKSDSVTVWIPITSMLLLSAVISVVSWAIQKILR